MQIVVCIKAVPGIILGAKVSEYDDSFEFKSRSLVMNEPDEYALEEALALRSKGRWQVAAITMGLPQSEEVLRTAVAKGADRAIRINAGYSDAGRTSLLLTKAIQGLEPNLILAGMESADNMGSQVAIAVASRLGVPFVFGVTEVVLLDANTVRVTKELGGGSSTVLEVDLPALLCIQTGIRRLSYVPYAKLIQARRRPLECINIGDLGLSDHNLETERRPRILDIFTPERRRKVEILSGKPNEIAVKVIEIIEQAR